jgi:hypothetical protein
MDTGQPVSPRPRTRKFNPRVTRTDMLRAETQAEWRKLCRRQRQVPPQPTAPVWLELGYGGLMPVTAKRGKRRIR